MRHAPKTFVHLHNRTEYSLSWHVPNGVLDGLAYVVIAIGGVEATAAMAVSGSVWGISKSVLLGTLAIWTGILGGGLLWYFDKYLPGGGWIRLEKRGRPRR